MNRPLFFMLMLFLHIGVVYAQDEAILRRQRAIFIYNITQQITWQSPYDVFTIGVMGNDPVLNEIEKMAGEGRRVDDKAIAARQFDNIEDIQNVQLVYLHQNYGYDIQRILDHVAGKNILVVAEDYGFNESMINMIISEGSYQFEINEARLREEKFRVSGSLKRLAITSSEKWEALYRRSSKSLEQERERVAEQQTLIEAQEKMILRQVEQVDSRSKEINRLTEEYRMLAERNRQQQVRYEERIDSLKRLEDQLDEKNCRKSNHDRKRLLN